MKKDYNFEIYSADVLEQIPDISEDDLKWLCNQSAEVYKECEKIDDYIDNYRVTRVIDSKVSSCYLERKDSGCCGSLDKPVKNPLTGNSFKIGFNFGH